jgi:hypothetical protein
MLKFASGFGAPKTRLKNRKKPPKNSKTFFKIMGITLQPLPITIPIALSIFTIIFWIKFICFCEWWDSNSQPLPSTYPPLPLHYYINYVYITYSFLMYYNKQRVIWLFETINEFIWNCDLLQSFITFQDLHVIFWWFLHPRSFTKFEFQIWKLHTNFSMIRWFQIKNLSITKFHCISRPTTFILVVFPSEVV